MRRLGRSADKEHPENQREDVREGRAQEAQEEGAVAGPEPVLFLLLLLSLSLA